MTIEHRMNGPAVILDLHGTLGVGSEDCLYDEVHSLMVDGCREFVLYMADVAHVDSAGLSELVGAYIAVTHAGGRIVLANLSRRVRQVLSVTKLLEMFEVADSETEAVACLSEGALVQV